MEFKLIKFDKLLNELKHNRPLEENLSKIIRDIEIEFDFQSLGIYLKIPSENVFRLKISRNISYTFTKTHIFSHNDELIKELHKFRLLDYKENKKFKFEKDYAHLLIMPIYFKKELLGFIFMDKKEGFFSDKEISKLRMFASIISLIIKIFVQQNEIEQLTENDEVTGLYTHRAFLARAEYLFSQVIRYHRDLTMVILKIDNYPNLIRLYGNEKTDTLMKKIADILKDDLRYTDIIGRIYTDTFAILMPESPPAKVISAIKRLNTHIMSLPEMKHNKIGWGISGRHDKISDIQEFLHITEEAAFESTRKNEKDNINVVSEKKP
ncbi:MAG: hypothetical protein B6D62_03300 [Candidatus Cloacimonas sp. 4484_275]|nr:MAG: hypothetical protein B6D62_03300 [Candidatus Cloacimonas sp. 4484_275]